MRGYDSDQDYDDDDYDDDDEVNYGCSRWSGNNDDD
jgi:hypothetical protein